MTATIFSGGNDLIVIFVALVFIGLPITVLVVAVRAIMHRHRPPKPGPAYAPWLDKDE